jgi:hypothetical protein
MKAFFEGGRCAGIFRHLFKPIGEFVDEYSHALGKFPTSSVEMLLWLVRQTVDR